jgi:hypothetical protein
VIPCDSEYSLIFCNSGIQIYQGIRKVFMAICAICMCANGTIVTDIFVGSVYLAIVVYLVFRIDNFYNVYTQYRIQSSEHYQIAHSICY